MSIVQESEQAVAIGEVISEAEERFERIRKLFGLIVGPILFVLLLVFPLKGVTPEAARLAAVLALTVTWWICESIPMPVTGMLGPCLAVVLGISEARTILAPFADPIIFIFIGSFILARAMTVHGLDRRIALTMLTSKWVGSSPSRVIFVFGAIAVLLSMWLSNTACTAMLLPIAIGITTETAAVISRRTGKPVDPRRLRFSTAIMLMTAYGASVGGIGTPIGTPPNLIGIGFIEKLTDTRITFGGWMTFAVPTMLVMFLFLFVVLLLLNRPERAELTELRDYLSDRRKQVGNWNRGQLNTILAFSAAVVLWTLPAVIGLIHGGNSPSSKPITRCFPKEL
jgi:solute carrier family 13 (sodium-dependent dicarboxylate transporter), member 2/3/5